MQLDTFEAFYTTHKALVYTVALNYLQNCEDAEEITQDVFVQVAASYQNFQKKASEKTWLYRITINKCNDFIKHKNSKKRFFMFGKKASNELELNNYSTFEHPGIDLEQKEDAAILFRYIGELTENQKAAFLLSKMDGLSNAEIAAILSLSISAVESLIFRAKGVLQEKLGIYFEKERKKK